MGMLEELYWNEQVKETLHSYQRQGRFPHAILLEGPTGTGKKTFARMLAAALFCKGEGERPCGVCLPCHKVREGIHPDLTLLGQEGGTRSFHIDVIRELKMASYVRPNEAEYRVVVLCDVQNMTVQAQNALLKLLEEPPEHSVFILTCQNRMSLLPTILSRLQVLPMELPTPQQCIQALVNLRPGHTAEEYKRAALSGEGALGVALAALESTGSQTLREEVSQLLNALLRENEFVLLRQLARYERDRDGFLALLGQFRGQVAAMLVLTAGGRTGDLAVVSPAFTALQLSRIADIIEETARQTAQNGNMPLLTTVFCSRLKSALG